MIGGVDHILEAPAGYQFESAQFDMLIRGLHVFWPVAVLHIMDEDPETRETPLHKLKLGYFSEANYGPIFIIYKDKHTYMTCTEQGVTEEIENDILHVYFFREELTFVTGTGDAARKLGENLCQAMLAHVITFSGGRPLPWGAR